MTGRFEELMQQLSRVLDIELLPDAHRIVALKIHQKIVVQLQEEKDEEPQLLIGSILCELPPGRFRENVLIEALKTNGLVDPRIAVLGYLRRKNALTMHQVYPYSMLDGQRLAALLSSFIEWAEAWRKAVEQGQVGPEPRQ
jgi:hypothetical protein